MTTTHDAGVIPDAADCWLVTSGPDGQSAKVVIGFDLLVSEVIGRVFADAEDDSEEASDMRSRLNDPDEWAGENRWSISWSFEDGYLCVQKITDATLLAAQPFMMGDAEPAIKPLAVNDAE